MEHVSIGKYSCLLWYLALHLCSKYIFCGKFHDIWIATILWKALTYRCSHNYFLTEFESFFSHQIRWSVRGTGQLNWSNWQLGARYGHFTELWHTTPATWGCHLFLLGFTIYNSLWFKLFSTFSVMPSLKKQESLVHGGSGPEAHSRSAENSATSHPTALSSGAMPAIPAASQAWNDLPGSDGMTDLPSLHSAGSSGEAHKMKGNEKKSLCHSFCHPAIKITM